MTVRTLSLLDALKLDATNLDQENFCGSGLKVHAIAAMFPLLEGKEFDELCLNMQSNGLQNAIVVLDGVLLDGRNRLRACAKTGIQTKFVEYGWRKNREDEWIVSQNLHRRSMTPDQRVALIAKYYDWRRAEEMARQARLAGLVAGGGKTRPCATESGSTTPVQQNAVAPPPPKSKNPTRDEIAEKAAVGGGKAAQAISVAKSRPDLLDAVASGKTTLRDAAKQVAPPKPKPALARGTALAAEIETQIEALKSGKINASQAAALLKDDRRQVADMKDATRRDKAAFKAARTIDLQPAGDGSWDSGEPDAVAPATIKLLMAVEEVIDSLGDVANAERLEKALLGHPMLSEQHARITAAGDALQRLAAHLQSGAKLRDVVKSCASGRTSTVPAAPPTGNTEARE